MFNKFLICTTTSLFCLFTFVTSAYASFVPFMCLEESVMNEIATAIAADVAVNPDSNAEPEVARKYIESGVCGYIPPFETTITYHGMKFGTEGVGPGVIEVVGFDSDGKRYFGMIPLNEDTKDSI